MPIEKRFFGKRIEDIPSEMPEEMREPVQENVSNYNFLSNQSFLNGEPEKAVLDEYQGRASKDYGDASALKVLSYSDNLVEGSNPSAAVLVNQIVQPKLYVATQADLERILKSVSLALQGTYEDSGLVLRSEGEPNSYLARNLYTQIKERNPKQELPVIIPLAGLELSEDKNSNYGLSFTLKEDAEIIYAPILNKPGDFSNEDINEKTGLPERTGNGNRTLYTRDSGLSRLCLSRYLGLYSRDDGLADSNVNGRVVVVDGSAEGAKK